MRELAIVVGVTAVMCVLSGVWFTPWETLYQGGLVVTAVGFLLGVPTGLMYHLRLYQALGPRGLLPPRWYWRPIPLNRRIPDHERGRVMGWCYAGGLGFVVICVGLLLMGAGVAMALIRGV